jgi:hypothetical protein
MPVISALARTMDYGYAKIIGKTKKLGFSIFCAIAKRSWEELKFSKFCAEVFWCQAGLLSWKLSDPE